MRFDPDRHSISRFVRQRKLSFPYSSYSPHSSTPRMLKEGGMQLLFVDQQNGLDVEDMMTSAREVGFVIPADMHPEDFLCMIIADHDESVRVWSSLRQAEPEETPTPPEPEIPGPPFEIIFADPPWPYRNKKTGGSHKSGAAQHYNIMCIEDILALPVHTLADKRCCLFLCCTVPMLREGLETMEAWGFQYKTSLFWHKTGRLGLGYWFRGNMELVLVGIRGKVPAFRCQSSNTITSKPGRHSEKPAELRELIASAAYPVLPGARLEMFSRGYFEGWDVFGDEIASTIELVEGEWRRKATE